MDNFQDLIMQLNDIKTKLKKYKTMETRLVNEVKDQLEDRGISKFETDDGVKVSCIESTKAIVDEEKLVNCIYKIVDDCNDINTKAQLLSCIIHKPCVDEDKLQELIYKGIVATEDIESAFTYKTTKTLRVFGGK